MVSEEAREKVGAMEKSELPCLCGEFDGVMMGKEDRYGFPLDLKLCSCGLLRADPYYVDTGDFYRGGLYGEIYRNGDAKTQADRELGDGKRIKGYFETHVGLRDYSVVEAGCGSGGIAKRFEGAKACDVDPAQVEAARRRGVDAIIGDRVEGKFDLVISSHLIEHMRDPVGYVKEVLDPMVGKYLYITTPGLWAVAIHYELDARNLFQNAHCWYFCLETLEYMMAQAGYGLVVGNQSVMSIWERREVDADDFYNPDLGEAVNSMLGAMLQVKQVVEGVAIDYRRDAKV